MIFIEPKGEKPFRDTRCARIIFFPPLLHGLPEVFYQQKLARTASSHNLELIFLILLFSQIGSWRQVRFAVRNFREVLIIGNNGLWHDYFTSTSNVWDVSLPKMSTTFTIMVYVPNHHIYRDRKRGEASSLFGCGRPPSHS